MELFINRISKRNQFIISISTVCIVSAICYGLSPVVGYKVVAFILLFTVSLLAITLDILPVLASALLSALLWDFFFIPPRFAFRVNSSEDVVLLLMYFVI